MMRNIQAKPIKFQYYVKIIYISIVFVALNILSFSWLDRVGFDVTQENRFTVSEHSIQLVQKIPEQVNLHFYISEVIYTQMPALKNYVERVQDFLEQLETHSDGRLKVVTHIIEPFSIQEENALAIGLQPIPLKDGTSVFMGIITENMVDGESIIPLLNPQNEAFIEYDIARLIQTVTQTKRVKLAIASSLPLETGQGGKNGLLNKTSQPYYIFQSLKQKYNLVGLSHDYRELLDLQNRPQAALIWHPRPLSDLARQNLLHYLSTGGRAFITLDPNNEAIPLPIGSTQRNAEIFSDMPMVLNVLGIDYDPNHIILDRQNAREITNPQTGKREAYYELLAINSNSFNQDNSAMATIKNLSFSTVGRLSIAENGSKKLKYTPLIQPNNSVDYVLRDRLKDIYKRDFLKKHYEEKINYTPAMLISGQLDHQLKNSNQKFNQPTEVIIVADSDFLDDRMWLQKSNTATTPKAFADNLNLVLNYVDYLVGDNTLIALRGKKRIFRPLEYLENIKKNARLVSFDKEKEIQQNITKLRQNIQFLKQNYAQTSAILPQKIDQEVQRFARDLALMRKKLRTVRKETQDIIKRSENMVKLFNVIIVPIVFAILSVIILIIRTSTAKMRAKMRKV